jgi:Nucleoside-diphosphate-sugar epimerases
LIIDSAAIVGGIGANNEFRVEFLSKKLQIQSNLMDAAHEADVERFVFLGSVVSIRASVHSRSKKNI